MATTRPSFSSEPSDLMSGLAVAVMKAPGSAVAVGGEEILVAGFDGVGKKVGVDERTAAAQRLGAADDLHDLGGDLLLAGPVHHPGEALDEVVGVVGRGLHGPLARRVLRC